MTADILLLEHKRQLAARVQIGAYYTDGHHLYETEQIGATGCIVLANCITGHTRCLSIEDFRNTFWLVATRSEAA